MDQHQFKIMLNHYLRNEMVKDDQGLAGLTDQMVERIFEKVRNIFKNDLAKILYIKDLNKSLIMNHSDFDSVIFEPSNLKLIAC